MKKTIWFVLGAALLGIGLLLLSTGVLREEQAQSPTLPSLEAGPLPEGESRADQQTPVPSQTEDPELRDSTGLPSAPTASGEDPQPPVQTAPTQEPRSGGPESSPSEPTGSPAPLPAEQETEQSPAPPGGRRGQRGLPHSAP